MAINFPNRSRSYDGTRQAVRFWGYDRSMESSFFVTADALNRIEPNLRRDAIDFLRVFDLNRDRIYAIAAKVYARGRRGSYELNAADV
jgi:hypothetical protein